MLYKVVESKMFHIFVHLKMRVVFLRLHPQTKLRYIEYTSNTSSFEKRESIYKLEESHNSTKNYCQGRFDK